MPGFVHDVCSPVYPFGAASPFFGSLPLQSLGVEWANPPLPVAHSLDGTDAVVISGSVGEAVADPAAAVATRRFRGVRARALFAGLLLGTLAHAVGWPFVRGGASRLAEAAAWGGTIADRPFVLLTQPTVADSSRAPAGRHVAWGDCHVRHAAAPRDLERANPNLVGGDIGGGALDLGQLFARPTWRRYRTLKKGTGVFFRNA